MDHKSEEMGVAQRWIVKGYEHFAKVGPANFSIKKISEEYHFSRTTFNYHFNSYEEFFKQLIATHLEYNKTIFEQAKQQVKRYSPDFFTLLFQYPIQLKFQLQLFNHRFNPEFEQLFNLCYKYYADDFLIKLFIEHWHLDLPRSTTEEIYRILLETWFSRLNICGISHDAMIENADNIINSILSIYKNQTTLSTDS